jgi:uncharacterized protein (DUF952 family)
MDLLFHIAPEAAWQAARQAGRYEAPSLAGEGFIHCSTREQVLEVANRLFRGRADLLLLAVDPGRVPARIRYENLEGGQVAYPHVYGPLPLAAVERVLPFPARPDGGFDWPDEA